MPARKSLIALCLVALAAPTTRANEPLGIVVSLPPQAWLAEQLTGGAADITVLLRDGASPETFAPSPRDVAALARAQVYGTAGVPFEAGLLKRIAERFPELHVVHLAQGQATRAFTEGEAAHEHHDHGEHDHAQPHDHGEWDPHTWLSPQLFAEQAARLAEALAQADPERAREVEARREALTKQLHELDRELAEMLKPYRGRTVFVQHAAYGYFLDHYGLHQRALETEGRSATPRELRQFLGEVGGQEPFLVTQPQVSQREARTLAKALGAQVIELDPLARDYPANLRSMAERLVEALAAGSSGDTQEAPQEHAGSEHHRHE